MARVAIAADDRQAANADSAVLAGEGQRIIATLLLRNVADLVVERGAIRGLTGMALSQVTFADPAQHTVGLNI